MKSPSDPVLRRSLVRSINTQHKIEIEAGDNASAKFQQERKKDKRKKEEETIKNTKVNSKIMLSCTSSLLKINTLSKRCSLANLRHSATTTAKK